ncbi:YggS family pyridoxal phosphate-dependent enzyme [Corynebacterium tapiri]|uniref:Pyridoxal phosphate homeostasis protein n=1 Tax=Corynebacterium tapiri TaxID=1448266 RepID=A0A5C4U5R8_9CORY|nr:YggS family pyridoxal phosphate-dependent enzyme [Corynebacterium tapiri]TNL99393.1 YggS family pyridoxal phosphate-dependent enzyme [Corynebacterium tapiri]
MDRLEELRSSYQRVQERLRAAEQSAGREPGSVELLPVTKFHPASDVALLAELGVSDVGENREQEARQKAAELPNMRFHMIGQVQTKKANAVARWAHSCHSVDSIKLANALERGVALAIERGERTETLSCFIQLSADGDTERGGVTAEGLDEVADVIESAEHLLLAGVMVVPPIDSDAGEVFTRARSLVDALAQRIGRNLRLSAGMSGDLEEAVAAGTDVVRVGTDILGKRTVA